MTTRADAASAAGRTFRPVVLIVMDGWGMAPAGPGNAIVLARTPVFDHLWQTYPHGVLQAGGEAVGLPPGQMGNSEVGHLNIGAGRVVLQELTRISKAIADGSFFRNGTLQQAFAKAVGRRSTVHVMGLVSGGGVHSDLGHLEAVLQMAAREHVTDVVVHAFLDGRDTAPRSALEYLARVDGFIAGAGVGRYGTVSGRFYAMDRDTRWERTRLAYDAMVHGDGLVSPSAQAAVESAYRRGENDEFVRPTVVSPDPAARIKDGDVCIFFNFRPDRARQLSRALFERDFSEFDRGPQPPAVDLVTMTRYKKEYPVPVAFPPEAPQDVLAEVLAAHGLRQLHIAETEKYAHVTFFFNGGREAEHPGERRILIPSPRAVPTYEHKPQMSAVEVTDELLAQLGGGELDFVVVNYANADMVGHTGDLQAAIAAVETVDACLGRVTNAVAGLDGVCLVTADHGNAESMRDERGGAETAHTTNAVPFIATVPPGTVAVREGGILADIAPTVLRLLGIEPPAAMTGSDLLVPPVGGG
ncbi:MAG: 2,3-bisphosphoglycerate-independent phosphoglycerate mutase [Actinobacteria bacterium]|nr:2,3-bisphosphoglycerate-independent phosphoglycerate mutase [Actinomycetota bacterium]